jgi:integrase/recombinase XerD
MNLLFKYPYALQNKYEGPLGQYMDSYAANMLEQGYARPTVLAHIRLLADFSRWLAKHRLAAEEITRELFPSYLRSRQSRHCRLKHNDPSALKRMLNLLIRHGVTAEPARPSPSPADQLLGEFASYLRKEKALAPRTITGYSFFVGQFLAKRFGTGPADLSTLSSSDVIEFVRHRAASMKCPHKSLTKSLRSFLRFGRYRGDLRTDLAACVPPIATRDLANLPKAIPADQTELVLASCDRTTTVGRRDYAILLLLARLGLRAIELVRLRLEDLDLQNGWITVRGKNGRFSKLPLPVEVGEALADYLRRGRPKSASRSVFLRTTAPIAGFKNSGTVSSVAKNAVLRTGIRSLKTGAHQFRHGLATSMLQRGASLPEIAELLRHRSFRTTALYARVDLNTLRALALPWPGSAS